MDRPLHPLAPPALGPRYRAVRLIARGGMGAVWEAQDLEREGRPVAVKVLGPVGAAPAVARRFEREAVFAPVLAGHDGLVAAHASGVTPGGQPFLVMELVPGETLEDLLEAGLELERGVRVLVEVARAVEFAHARGVVHRDLKPANIMVDDAGRARVLDYGVAKVDGGGPSLTGTGERLGSPCYMAPEQLEDSKRVDARTDVYALGAVLYQVLTGEVAFDGANLLDILRRVATNRFTPPEVDPELDAVCVRALSLDPARRHPSAEAFAQDLEGWLARHADPNVGRTIAGKYELLARLGQGGMGVVYRARQALDGREVALKLVRPDLLREPAARARFLREVATAQAFVHKHAVVVRDYGEDRGALYLTMDLVRGETLLARARARGGRLPPAEVLAIGRQALEALVEAHAAGIVHRDLKPENLMLEDGPKGPQARILDFGIAQAVDGDDPQAATDTGRVVGTLRYMSPEQAAGDAVDARSDLWSLGVVLYEALAGRLPHEAESNQQLLYRLATQEPTPLDRAAPDVPGPVARAVMLALRRDRAQRPADAATWLRALDDAATALARIPATRASARLPARPPSGGQHAARPVTGTTKPLDALLPPPPPARRGALAGVAVAVLAVAALLAAGLWYTSTRPAPGPIDDAYARAIQQSAVDWPRGAPRDTTAPTIDVTAPDDGLETEDDAVMVAAVVSDAALADVRLNGASLGAVADVTTRVPLALGPNTLTLEATDAAGNTARATRTVTRLAIPPPPEPPLAPGLVRGPEPRTAVCEKDGSVLVWVPAASYRRGHDLARDAVPERVQTQGLWLGRTEVTWAQYRRFCQATGRPVPRSELLADERTRFEAGPDHPVFNVTWADARAYCDRAGLRLPTEAEWEYAAGAGLGARYPWGRRAPVFGERLANAGLQVGVGLPGQEDGVLFTAPAGSFPDGASPFGALDLIGNVDEWCEDWFAPYGAPSASGGRRVYRGGSWATPLRDCAVWARASAHPEYASAHLGFRVAVSP